MYCVRRGDLESVEYLASQPRCRLDARDREQRSLADVAVAEWLKMAHCAAAQSKSVFARR